MPTKSLYLTRYLYIPERLLSEMEKSSGYPLTVIEAPMGYGKTTLVRELLKGAEADILWQKVFAPSPDLFWTDFSRLFSFYDKELSCSLMQMQLPEDPVSRHEAVTLIETMLQGRKAILVIDDFQLVNHKDSSEFITFLVLQELENLKIILITRAIFLNRFEELKLKGYAYHITKDTLEFKPEDIRQYYKNCGISLKSKELHYLHHYTEGWISALYLLMVSYINNGTFSHSKNIDKIIEQSIYQSFSAESQDFLLSLCLFERAD